MPANSEKRKGHDAGEALVDLDPTETVGSKHCTGSGEGSDNRGLHDAGEHALKDAREGTDENTLHKRVGHHHAGTDLLAKGGPEP